MTQIFAQKVHQIFYRHQISERKLKQNVEWLDAISLENDKFSNYLKFFRNEAKSRMRLNYEIYQLGTAILKTLFQFLPRLKRVGKEHK